MGGKSSTEVVRHGADKAVVACVFESTPGAEAILEENGIDAEGNEIILRREILSTAKEESSSIISRPLLPCSSQLARNWLLSTPRLKLSPASTRPSSAFCSIASAASPQTPVPKRILHGATARSKLNELLHGEQDRLRMVDLWSYQHKEIESAHLHARRRRSPGNRKARAGQRRKALLRRHERLRPALRRRSLRRSSSARCPAATSKNWLATTAASAMPRSRSSPPAPLWATVSATLRDYAEGINASPERLAEIEDRLALSRSPQAQIRQNHR